MMMLRKKTIKEIKAGIAGLFLCLIFLIASIPSMAAGGSPSVVQKYTTDEEIGLYINNPSGSISDVTYQVGTTACEVESLTAVKDCDESVYTLILWDNSLSVMRKYGTRIQSLLVDMVANRCGNEKFAIVLLGEEAQWLTDFTDEYSNLKTIITNVKEEDKDDAFIIENLYSSIELFNESGDSGFKRIVLISDGMDDSKTGYSREEIDNLLKKTPYPIYAIGAAGEDESNGLQKMFAFSRSTQGEYFLLSTIEDDLTILNRMSQDYDIVQVKATVPWRIQDGSTQNSKLSFSSYSGDVDLQCEVTLPFISEEARKEKEEEERVASSEEEEEDNEDEIIDDDDNEDEQEEDGEEDEDEDEDEATILGLKPIVFWAIVGGGAGIIILIIIIVAVNSNKKKKNEPPATDYAQLDQRIKNERYINASQSFQNNTGAQNSQGMQNNQSYQNYGGMQRQNYSAMMGTNTANEGKTQMLAHENQGAEQSKMNSQMSAVHKILLVNTADPTQAYQCSIKDKILIGRNPAVCNLAIPTDGAVSERHCEVSVVNNQFCLRDVGSSNGTMVNGQRITQMVEIKTGFIITLGRNEYRIILE